jgi:hypothetical protein
MKITYTPQGVNNFHNCAPIRLIVSGPSAEGNHEINRRQNQRLERHFCGVVDCHCPAGASRQVDEAGTRFTLRAEWCDK